MPERRLSDLKFGRERVVTLCCAAMVVSIMGLILADYLFQTYVQSSIQVVFLASLIVAATVGVSYWQGRRICARKSKQLTVQK